MISLQTFSNSLGCFLGFKQLYPLHWTWRNFDAQQLMSGQLTTRLLLVMVQKSGTHQLRLVAYPLFAGFCTSQVVVWDFWTINSIVKALSIDAFVHALGISDGDEHVTCMIKEVGELLGCLNWTIQIYHSLLQRFNESCGNGEQPKVWVVWYRQNLTDS